MNKLVVDLKTGEQVLVPLSQEELDARYYEESKPDITRILFMAREEMSNILNSMTVEDKFLLFKTRIAVEEALNRGELELARYMVEQQEVPERLLPTKKRILALFPQF